MQYAIGIATKLLDTGEYAAAAVAYHNIKPPFSTRGMTIKYMQSHLLSLVNVTNTCEKTAVEAAVQRTFELLFLKKQIANPQNSYPPVQVYTTKKFKTKRLSFRHKTPKTHWLLTGAKRTLEELYGAKNGRRHHTRSKKPKSRR